MLFWLTLAIFGLRAACFYCGASLQGTKWELLSIPLILSVVIEFAIAQTVMARSEKPWGFQAALLVSLWVSSALLARLRVGFYLRSQNKEVQGAAHPTPCLFVPVCEVNLSAMRE